MASTRIKPSGVRAESNSTQTAIVRVISLIAVLSAVFLGAMYGISLLLS